MSGKSRSRSLGFTSRHHLLPCSCVVENEAELGFLTEDLVGSQLKKKKQTKIIPNVWIFIVRTECRRAEMASLWLLKSQDGTMLGVVRKTKDREQSNGMQRYYKIEYKNISGKADLEYPY